MTIDHSRSVFFTTVTAPQQIPGARLLIQSLRTFGGPLAGSTFWIIEADPMEAPCAELVGDAVEILPLAPTGALRSYWYGSKVAACARAEARSEGLYDSCVWMATDCLIVQPPKLLTLDPEFDIAVRPVHHRNIGLKANTPLDAYWSRVYAELGIDDVALVTPSFVKQEPLRAYFNTHALAVNPALGICRRWRDTFEALAGDPAFQSSACSDIPHRIFLHQATFSPIVATAIPEARIRILPPTYSYPYNLHDDVPADRRPASLNDLVSIAYEDRALTPNSLSGITVREPLRTWLSEHVDRSES
jgi:hypothetical protein